MTPISLNLSSIVHLETICPLYLLLNFLFIKYLKNSGNIPKRILQTHGIIHSIHKENTYGVTPILPKENISFRMVPLPTETHGTHQHITIPSRVFNLWGTFTITNVIEEIFEVNAN